ncbi:unnamed protein product [Prorocentrum cordatum]|uniref:Uncharacterized protein n=1 Tax=Prorocentrum cordatum TaxID=2364126 RepID=A0ABN9YH68_9DINO|nr:unnamed protein product [Polarella glacialis]
MPAKLIPNLERSSNGVTLYSQPESYPIAAFWPMCEGNWKQSNSKWNAMNPASWSTLRPRVSVSMRGNNCLLMRLREASMLSSGSRPKYNQAPSSVTMSFVGISTVSLCGMSTRSKTAWQSSCILRSATRRPCKLVLLSSTLAANTASPAPLVYRCSRSWVPAPALDAIF